MNTRTGVPDEVTRKLVEDLKALAVDVLGRGIERMFDGADDMLFEMARRATSNKDQRVYFDTMRVVRLGRPKIGRIFRDEIFAGFSPVTPEQDKARSTDIAFDELSLQESKSLEETIAISTMATKAEGLYTQLLFDLNRRIDWLIKEKHAPLSDKALSPATISNAFRRSAESLDVEFDIEIVIFKLFDRLVISDLGELYTRTLRFFDQHGVRAAPVGGSAPRAAAPAIGAPAGSPPPGMMSANGSGLPPGGMSGSDPGMGAGYGPSGGYGMPGPGYGAPGGNYPVAQGGGYGVPATGDSYGFSSPPMMDAATLNALRQMSATGSVLAPSGGGGGGGGFYGDMQLSSDLAAAAQGRIVPGWESPRAYAYVQRAGVVGRMFNDILEDPTLPAPLKPRFDQLRFAVIKNALRDSSFFTDKQHPVRGLMNELTTMAAAARASGMEALKRIEDLVGQIQGQFDVAADSIRSQTALPGPVDERTLEELDRKSVV
jgi:hypothetical protein